MMKRCLLIIVLMLNTWIVSGQNRLDESNYFLQVVFGQSYHNDPVSLTINGHPFYQKIRITTNPISGGAGPSLMFHVVEGSMLVTLFTNYEDPNSPKLDTFKVRLSDFVNSNGSFSLQIKVNGTHFNKEFEIKEPTTLTIHKKKRFLSTKIRIVENLGMYYLH